MNRQQCDLTSERALKALRAEFGDDLNIERGRGTFGDTGCDLKFSFKGTSESDLKAQEAAIFHAISQHGWIIESLVSTRGETIVDFKWSNRKYPIIFSKPSGGQYKGSIDMLKARWGAVSRWGNPQVSDQA